MRACSGVEINYIEAGRNNHLPKLLNAKQIVYFVLDLKRGFIKAFKMHTHRTIESFNSKPWPAQTKFVLHFENN